jgi:hypothetical protein
VESLTRFKAVEYDYQPNFGKTRYNDKIIPMATKLVEAELKSTRVVPFSGKREDWDMWQIKHVGRARVRGKYGV